MSEKEVEEKISSVREMVKKYVSWKNCSRERIAKINRTYADAISALVLSEADLSRIEAEKRIIDRLGHCLISFSKVGSEHHAVVIASQIAITWRWECAHSSNKEIADAFKHSRLQWCAAANMPLWMGALYASEVVSAVTSTKPTDF